MYGVLTPIVVTMENSDCIEVLAITQDDGNNKHLSTCHKIQCFRSLKDCRHWWDCFWLITLFSLINLLLTLSTPVMMKCFLGRVSNPTFFIYYYAVVWVATLMMVHAVAQTPLGVTAIRYVTFDPLLIVKRFDQDPKWHHNRFRFVAVSHAHCS